MRKLYREYFEVSPTEKISDKVMLTRVVFTVITMLICLSAMSLSAYAYFSATVSAGPGVISSASFDIDIQITRPGNLSIGSEGISQGTDEVSVSLSDNNKYCASLEAGKTYTVTLSKKGNASTGFCLISFEGGSDQFTTVQLGKDVNAQNGERLSLTFTVSPDTDTVIYLSPCWGTSSFYSDLEAAALNPLFVKDGDSVNPTYAFS